MTGVSLYVFILSSLSFSIAFGNQNYFEHFFNKYHHHKSSSTTPSTSSTTEISTAEVIKDYNQDDDETEFFASTMHSGDLNDYGNGTTFLTEVASIVAGIIFFVLVIGCIVCCCKNCNRAETRGYIIRTAAPSDPVVTPAPQQSAIVQHAPPEYTQEPVQQFPPQYQQPVLPQPQYGPMQQLGYQYSPVQQQPQYSPVQPQTHYSPVPPGYQNTSPLQFYNPPEAPPPYETKPPYQ